MEAVYVLAAKQRAFYQKTVSYAVRKVLLPLLRRVRLREAMKDWRATKVPMVTFSLYPQESIDSVSSAGSRSSGASFPYLSSGSLLRNESIGEMICPGARDDDRFYLIRQMKKGV